ncbi:MAG: prepilin-type N-terminal cleavage/methylation domain-containing protein [Ilumatobacteraceae bacterium]
MRTPDDRGFTLIEVLIAIVLVGILSAVAVVGVGRLTDRAGAATCSASADAALTAANTFLVNNATYPATFEDLTRTTNGGAPLVVPANATVAGRTMTLGGWRLSMSTASPPAFTCAAFSTTVVDAAHTGGWSFLDDNAALGNSGQFVTGPGTPPSGTGSARLNLAGPTQGAILSIGSFASTRLDRITNMTYSTFQPAGSLAPVLAFDVRFRPTDSGYAGRLVFMQDSSVTSATPVWRTWSTLDGRWYASHADRGTPQSSLGACPMSSPCTWAQVLTRFPEASISPGGALVFKAGSNWPASSYNVDGFTIGVRDAAGATTETTYDFEP